MANPPSDDLMRTVAEVALERLMHGEAVVLPGVGRLEVRHRPSHQRETDEDRRELVPPRDYVEFVDEANTS